MNKEYYDNLVIKLESFYKTCIESEKSDIFVKLTKRELEDLHYLFKHQAPKIWTMTFALEKEGEE